MAWLSTMWKVLLPVAERANDARAVLDGMRDGTMEER
jgi:hypothetical protein